MTTLTLRDLGFVGGLTPASSYDTDAQTYITAVETADGQALETAVRDAINAFVVGCKTDGIWTAIKSSCILAGARTLTGALVPLVGTAPTNNNFVSGDYNRKTGLTGNGTSKYIDSNRADNADLQNDAHRAIWVSTADTRNALEIAQSLIGSANSGYASRSHITAYNSSLYSASRGAVSISTGSLSNATGFMGTSRSSSAQYTFRRQNINQTVTATSVAPGNQSIVIFADKLVSTVDSWTNARLAFYSLGSSLDLALLNSRVSTLLTAYSAAIP